MAVKRFTMRREHPDPAKKVVYHIPMHWVGEFVMKTFGHNTYMYGDIVNKLGKYEDLGEPDEIARKLGAKMEWMK